MQGWVAEQRRELANALERSMHTAPQYDAVGESVRYLYRVWRKRRIGAVEARSLFALRKRVTARLSILRHAATGAAASDASYAGLRSLLAEHTVLEREIAAIRGGDALRRAGETRARALQGPEREPPPPPLRAGLRSGELVANRFTVGQLLTHVGGLTAYEGSTEDGARAIVHFCDAALDRDALYLGSVFGDRQRFAQGPALAIEWEGEHAGQAAFVTLHPERYPLATLLGSLPCSAADAVRMMDQLLETLGRLHGEGVAHGGIGPATVLVAHTGIGQGRIKLLALGAFGGTGPDARTRDLRGALWTGACALAGRLVDDDDDAILDAVDEVSGSRLAAWFHKHLRARVPHALAMRDELRVGRMADEADAVPHLGRLRDLERAAQRTADRVDAWLDRMAPPPLALASADLEHAADADVVEAVERASVCLESLESELGVYLEMVKDVREGFDRRYRRKGMATVALLAICCVVAPVIFLEVNWDELLTPAVSGASSETGRGAGDPEGQPPGRKLGRFGPQR